MSLTNDLSRRTAALIAGIGFLVSFAGAIYSAGFANSLIVPGDATLTAQNLNSALGQFRAGIVSWLFVIIGDLVRAWAVYVFFKEVNKSVALLSAWFMLLHDAVFGNALVNLIMIANIGSNPAVLGFEQSYSLIFMLFEGFNAGFNLGLFFFSFHLGLIGYLVLKTDFIPKIYSYLLFVAFIGYFLNSTGSLFPAYPELMEVIFIAPCLIGEMAIMMWLMIKGGKEGN